MLRTHDRQARQGKAGGGREDLPAFNGGVRVIPMPPFSKTLPPSCRHDRSPHVHDHPASNNDAGNPVLLERLPTVLGVYRMWLCCCRREGVGCVTVV